MTAKDERRVSKALQGLEFPSSKERILAYAQERNVDAKILQALHALPEGSFSNNDEVEQALPHQPRSEEG